MSCLIALTWKNLFGRTGPLGVTHGVEASDRPLGPRKASPGLSAGHGLAAVGAGLLGRAFRSLTAAAGTRKMPHMPIHRSFSGWDPYRESTTGPATWGQTLVQ